MSLKEKLEKQKKDSAQRIPQETFTIMNQELLRTIETIRKDIQELGEFL